MCAALIIGIGGALALPIGMALARGLDRILKAMPGVPADLHFFVFQPRAVAVHVALLVAQAKALQEVVNGFDQPGLPLPFMPEGYLGTDSAFPANVMAHQIQNFPHVATGQWVLSPLGGAPPWTPRTQSPSVRYEPCNGNAFLE